MEIVHAVTNQELYILDYTSIYLCSCSKRISLLEHVFTNTHKCQQLRTIGPPDS